MGGRAVLIGYFAGGSISTAQDLLRHTSLIGLTLLTVITVITVITYLRRRGRIRQTGEVELRQGSSEQSSSRAQSAPGPSPDRRATIGS